MKKDTIPASTEGAPTEGAPAAVGAFAAGVGAAAIWGGMYAVSKVVLETIPPFALLSLRLLLGFAVLASVALVRKSFKTTGRDAIRFLGAGFIGYGVSLSLQFLGTKLSNASSAALVTSATPALVLPFAALILKERITARRVAALLAATAGVVLVIEPWRSTAGDGGPLTGNLLLVGAAATWALYSVLAGKASRESDVLVASAIMLLGGLPTSLIFGAIEIANVGVGTIDGGIIAGVLFLGVVSTAVAMFLWNYAFARLEASRASLAFFAQPLVGALLGWALLGETIGLLFVAGGALIAIGLAIGSKD